MREFRQTFSVPSSTFLHVVFPFMHSKIYFRNAIKTENSSYKTENKKQNQIFQKYLLLEVTVAPETAPKPDSPGFSRVFQGFPGFSGVFQGFPGFPDRIRAAEKTPG